MRFGSVCSGIEAASVAWKPLGWDAAWLSEIDAFPSAVLAHHQSEVPNLGDMNTLIERIPKNGKAIELLVGGTPCQSFSVAGLRKGLADPRGNLALVFLGLLDSLRPRWVVWENVPGVLSSTEGRDFGSFLGGLGELGYGFAYRVLDAQYFGVPQRRRRVFVIGYLGDWRPAAAVLFERSSMCGDPPPSREKRQGSASGFETGPNGGRFSDLAPTLDARAKDGPIRNQLGMGNAHAVADTLNASGAGTTRPAGQGNELDFCVPVANCVTTKEGQRQDPTIETLLPIIAFGANDSGQDASKNVSPTLRAGGHKKSHANNGVPPAIAIQSVNTPREKKQNGLGVAKPGDPMYSIAARDQHAIAFMGGQGAKAGSVAASETTSPTIRGTSSGTNQVPSIAFNENVGSVKARDYKGINSDGNGAEHVVKQGMQVRRLTPRECERLQGFPDDYTLIPYRGGYAADGPRYKALGNSMAVPVMRWIGTRIELVDEIIKKEKR